MLLKVLAHGNAKECAERSEVAFGGKVNFFKQIKAGSHLTNA